MTTSNASADLSDEASSVVDRSEVGRILAEHPTAARFCRLRPPELKRNTSEAPTAQRGGLLAEFDVWREMMDVALVEHGHSQTAFEDRR